MKSFINLFILFFFFLEKSENIIFANEIIPNENGYFKMEGNKAIFEGGYITRSLIFEEGISDGVMEVFVFYYLSFIIHYYYYYCCLFIYILYTVFIYFYLLNYFYYYLFFLFLFILF
jgi:hypothetical protein